MLRVAYWQQEASKQVSSEVVVLLTDHCPVKPVSWRGIELRNERLWSWPERNTTILVNRREKRGKKNLGQIEWKRGSVAAKPITLQFVFIIDLVMPFFKLSDLPLRLERHLPPIPSLTPHQQILFWPLSTMCHSFTISPSILPLVKQNQPYFHWPIERYWMVDFRLLLLLQDSFLRTVIYILAHEWPLMSNYSLSLTVIATTKEDIT